MNWYLDVLKKYAVFSGRASRKEYWMFVLFNLIVVILLSLVLSFLGVPKIGQNVISNIYSLGIIIPSLAVLTRRYHDIGRSGWWMLLNIGCVLFIIPAMILGIMFTFSGSAAGSLVMGIFLLLGLACAITSLVFCVTKSQAGSNKYGPNPYETTTAQEAPTPSLPA